MKKFSLGLLYVLVCGQAYAATDANKPYIGAQTETGWSNGDNNGVLQNLAPWGSNVTNVMGKRLGYITPGNTTGEGGLWAGDKAAAVTYGSADKGVFVDKNGVQIRNTDLDVTGHQIHGVKAGEKDDDAVNVSQLKESEKNTREYADEKAQQAEVNANTYTDEKAKDTLKEANTYTDEKAKDTLKKANTHADEKAQQAEVNANAYTDGKAKEAHDYTDSKAKETLNSANSYADQKAAASLEVANSYTDQQINKLDKRVNKGLASAAALSGLFQPYNVGKFNLSAGVGGYRGESSIAVGTGYRFNENIAAKAGVSTSFGDSSATMYNAAVNFEW
ncbi:MAG: YadA-like family protein [Enterobacteriaceae bacterium]|jgi:adhesin YadA|nr:YadA-like family protein [Enterobacteriaceae bacterium]